jgi:hypothetical protein
MYQEENKRLNRSFEIDQLQASLSVLDNVGVIFTFVKKTT